MKLVIPLACAIALFAMTSQSAFADDGDDEGVKAGPRITLDPNIVLPLGNLADIAGFGFGATVAFRLPINANIGLSARTGFLYHLPKNDFTVLVLPLYGGLTYGFKPSITTPYVAAEFGLAYSRASNSSDAIDTASETGFAATLGGGYRLSFGDLRAGLQVYDFGDFGDSISLFVTAAFRIANF